MSSRSRRARHAGTLFVTAVLAASLAASAKMQDSKHSEFEIKAAYLYNFGRFVAWPPESLENEKSFQVCVLGRDPFGNALDKILANEKIQGKPAMARRISEASAVKGCQVLFISSSEEARLGQILTVMDSKSVLTVSDISDFSARGGMIEFVRDQERVRFEVNLDAAEAARLTMSSDLLKVALFVRKKGNSGD
jgi:YfiR/HmsC-like